MVKRKLDLGKKKRRRNAWFVIIALLLIGGVALFAQQFSVTEGFSTLSLDRVDFESNDPTVGGQAFLLNVVQNGAGQYARGTFTTSDLNQELSDEGVEVSESLRIDLSTEGQECVYNIRNSGDVLSDLVVVEQGDCLTTICLNNARDRCNGVFANEGGFISRKDFICLDYELVGAVGTIDFDRLDFETTVDVTVGDEDFSGVISNSGERSVSLGDNRVHASWQGNLVSGESCPSPAGQGVVALYTNGWSVVSESAYENWKINADSLLDCLDLANNNDGIDYDSCVTEYQGLTSLASRSVDFVAEGGSSVDFSGSANAGELRLPLGRLIQYPMITMRVSADTLGIVLPVGVPKIVDVSSDTFATGDDGNIRVEVENVGESLGVFVASVECSGDFSPRGTSPSFQVPSGSSAVLNIPLSAGSAGTSGCVVTVADVENPFNRDISTVRVSADPLVTCDTGDIRCVGDVEQVCRAGVWEVTGTGACEIEYVEAVEPISDLVFVFIVLGITILLVVLMVVFKRQGVFE